MIKYNIRLDKLPIRLGQFLKFANVAQDGHEAKILITNGQVMVNGIIEVRRGRQLLEGDIVEINNETLLKVLSKK